jgi:hypothetical protein
VGVRDRIAAARQLRPTAAPSLQGVGHRGSQRSVLRDLDVDHPERCRAALATRAIAAATSSVLADWQRTLKRTLTAQFTFGSA